MFFDGDFTAGRKVNLRGKSKQEDRKEVLARAQREREKREKERTRLKAVLKIQSVYRSYHCRVVLNASAREEWDLKMDQMAGGSLSGSEAVSNLQSLLRLLIFFHSPANPTDAARRLKLCMLLLQSMASGPESNWGVQMCSTDQRSTWLWHVKCCTLLCLRSLDTSSAVTADGQHCVELQVVLYFTDADKWTWLGDLLPPERAQTRSHAGEVCFFLGRHGLHARVRQHMLALLRPVSAAGDNSDGQLVYLTHPLVEALFALCVRCLSAARSVPNPVGGIVNGALTSQAWLFAQHVLTCPGILISLPRSLVSSLVGDTSLFHSILQGLSDKLSHTTFPQQADFQDRAGEPVEPLAWFLGNLLTAGQELPDGSPPFVLSEYVHLLHTAVSAIPAVLLAPQTHAAVKTAPSALSDSDEEEAEAKPDAQVAGLLGHPDFSAMVGLLGQQLSCLYTSTHIALLFEALLPATACGASTPKSSFSMTTSSQPTLHPALAKLCGVYCQVLYAGGNTVRGRPLTALNALSFTQGFVGRLWAALQLGAPADEVGRCQWHIEHRPEVLTLFCSCYSHLLIVVEDEEFFEKQRPFSLAEVVPMSLLLKEVALYLYWHTLGASKTPRDAIMQHTVTRLLRQLYDRDSRRSFVGGADHWLAQDASKVLAVEALAQRMDPLWASPSPANTPQASSSRPALVGEAHDRQRCEAVLTHIPFVVPFEARLRILRSWVQQDRATLAAERMMWPPVLTVRRDLIVEDSFNGLHSLGPNLKFPLRVQFLNPQGLEEAGVGEGVSKEFLTELLKHAFSPQVGLLKESADGELYPNPASHSLFADHISLFEFLGAVLAKAVYEGMLVDMPLAGFFLSKLLGRTNNVNDLPSLDPELYRNLLFLKHYDGDVEDLSLFFAVTEDRAGSRASARVVDLKAGGRDIPVNRHNRTEYIFLMAHYRLTVQLRRQSEAFLRGFSSIIPQGWIQMFSPNELQLVISGCDAPVDIADWRDHCVYSGGYTDDHPTIQAFWTVVAELPPQEHAMLLKFATSCSRPPLLGFEFLHPPFCIHKASNEEERLPTSSTCMNLLKLPPYLGVNNVREKLKYAIHAGCGFELS